MDNIAFTDETRNIGKPVDWVEELDGPCISISVHDFVDDHTGLPFMMTAWRPDAGELARLNSGEGLYLCISGKAHPVIKLYVGEAQ